MNASAINTARAAIKTALVGLDAAYKALDVNCDVRIEDFIVSLTDELNERLSDLDNHAEQLEADRAPWFSRYEAA
jgi:cell division protein ZapA (FtsZ GTPase activity inhibitor)